jgi:hypothetical protein
MMEVPAESIVTDRGLLCYRCQGSGTKCGVLAVRRLRQLRGPTIGCVSGCPCRPVKKGEKPCPVCKGAIVHMVRYRQRLHMLRFSVRIHRRGLSRSCNEQGATSSGKNR